MNPVNLCNTWEKSLDKIINSGNTGTLNTKQVIFIPHKDEDCKLLFRQKKRQKNLDFKSVDAELKKCHFHKTEVDLKDYITGQKILDHGVL